MTPLFAGHPPVTLRRVLKVCGLLLAILVVLSLVSLTLGAASISAGEVIAAVWESLFGSATPLAPDHELILFGLRLPRILLAMIVGAALAMAGAAYQALLRNPLADPYILGVSSGAGLGAILSLVLAAQFAVATPAAAFVGAVATIALVYYLGRPGEDLSPYTLLLAGVMAAYFLSALMIFLINFLSGRDLRGATFWLMGDLSNPSPVPLFWLALAVGAAAALLYAMAGNLNLLLGGEPEAEALGVDVRRTKIVVYLTASFVTGLAVSVSGAIGYVGLLVPHLIRLLFGTDYRLLIPASALGGAIVLLLGDTVARTAMAPTELPVGAVMAIAGAPVFVYLLRRPRLAPPPHTRAASSEEEPSTPKEQGEKE